MLPAYASHIGTIALEICSELEGSRDASGDLRPGDLDRRLAAIGAHPDPPPGTYCARSCLTPEDRAAKEVALTFIERRIAAGIESSAAAREFIHEVAYTWTNRFLALRCMEARGLIDEIIVQKQAHGGRSLQHHRLAEHAPARCSGE